MRRLNPWNPPNVRFWVWWNDGPVKLMLRPGQTLTLHTWSPNDEGGYSSTTEVYEHEGESIRLETTDDGRDCDGRLTREWRGRARLDAEREPLCHFHDCWPETFSYAYEHDGRPCEQLKFEKIKSWQRDEYAEAAGY